MKTRFPTEMTMVDLTHTLAPGMPYFPGTEGPIFSRPFTVADHGFSEQRITMLTHSGTHMDAPAHILEVGPKLEQLGLPHFVGSATVLDVTDLPLAVIGVDDLRPGQQLLAGKDFVLLRTGWSAT